MEKQYTYNEHLERLPFHLHLQETKVYMKTRKLERYDAATSRTTN